MSHVSNSTSSSHGLAPVLLTAALCAATLGLGASRVSAQSRAASDHATNGANAPTRAEAQREEAPRFAFVPRGREVMLHGFRNPGIGVELREGMLGFHVTMYPTIVDQNAEGESRTTWFAKLGVSLYFLAVDTGSGRMSSLYIGVALLQGLNNEWNVTRSASRGTALMLEAGARWAAVAGLDLRLGVGFLIGQGEVFINPTPGLSWAVAF